jgi:Carboxypeptidase regulatory-like domain
VGSMRSTKRNWAFKVRKWVLLSASLCVPLCAFSVPLVGRQTPVVWELGTNSATLQETASSTVAQAADGHTPGNIRGRVVDQSGAHITGALVKFTPEGQSSSQEVESDEEGQFFFFNIDPGAFQLTITSEGLASQTVSGSVKAGETYVVPQVTMVVATLVTEVRVGLPPDELAQVQIEAQEKQRAFGFVPNFYVSYVGDAAPLSPRLKFRLAWKSATDPVTLAGVGWLAGIDQATDRWGAYGQGLQGYAKRYAATYANVFGATFLGGAVLPSLLKQDPRYFYKGTGSKRSRILYAISNSVICKGDNGRWQPNYSNVLGSFGAAGLANLYYPEADRRGAASVVATGLIRLGETSLAAILQEFVFPRFSPNRSRRQSQP